MQRGQSVFLVSASLILLLISSAQAAHWSTDPIQIQMRVKEIVTRLLCLLLLLSPGVVFGSIVIGIMLLLLNAENAEKRASAKEIIKNAIFGGILVIALVQVAGALPTITVGGETIDLAITIDVNTCLNMEGGGGPAAGVSDGPKGYLVYPPNGGTIV